MSSKRYNMQRSRPATVSCYDCGQQVAELKPHRSVCPKSRKNKSKVNPVQGKPKVFAKEVDGKQVDLTEQDLATLEKLGISVNTAAPAPRDTSAEVDFYALIDVSGSMAVGGRLENAKIAMTQFFDTMKENDRFSIVSFDSNAFFKLKPRPVGQLRRQNELPDILNRIFAQGQTALYDAIYMTVEQIRDKTKKTIINVLTDGEDNSSIHTYGGVLSLVAQYPNITLNITHIDESGKGYNPYYELCHKRGVYTIIKETQVVTETTRIFLSSYTA